MNTPNNNQHKVNRDKTQAPQMSAARNVKKPNTPKKENILLPDRTNLPYTKKEDENNNSETEENEKQIPSVNPLAPQAKNNDAKVALTDIDVAEIENEILETDNQKEDFRNQVEEITKN